MLIHGTAVAIDSRGVLLIGPSGSGKSDLAWRLIDRGAVLIADDAVNIMLSGDMLFARPSADDSGLLVAGLGQIDVPKASQPVALSLELILDPERHQPSELGASASYHGLFLPNLALNAFHASAPLVVELALRRYGL